MRKPVVLSLIVSMVAACGCNQQKLGPMGAPVEVGNRTVVTSPTPTPDKGYDKSPAANTSGDVGPTVFAASLAILAAPFTWIGHQYDLAEGHTPDHAVQQMNNQTDADQRRLGIIDMVTTWSFGRRPPYTTQYKDIAQNDPDFTVRAMAIRALNISRDASATPIFISALSDEHQLIRLEAVKALGNIPDPAAIGPLEELLEGGASGDESLDVRIAAADSLRRYPDLDVARNLVGYLNERDFSIAWQSHQSLTALTGRDLRYDQAAWLAYLTGPDRPFR